MNYFHSWREHAGSRPEKFFKTTLWEGEHLVAGLNCLEPGQTQATHAHAEADKFYFILEGQGIFTIGEVQQEAEAGTLVVAPASVPHGVRNEGQNRLTILVAIAPPIK
jgi:mannose-6-phosphate isomerase-like protein (cupin superfamily)